MIKSLEFQGFFCKLEDKKMKTCELLAPAGDFECLKAAVYAGADAVYLGGSSFGARRSATNFGEEELKEAIRFCHERQVNLYVTVNTLIKDDELDSLISYLDFLYREGVDAIIIQDLGVWYLVKQRYPDLECHASTQMTLHNIWDVAWAEKEGLDRVVLARELGLEDLKEIRKFSSLPLEVFVHGALCIGYSGNCLLSSYIGGRSGNRGACAQPCRKAYDLVELETGNALRSDEGIYLMSPKDINAQSILKELKALEPISLKIEGRMKSADYVYSVVKSYRDWNGFQGEDFSLFRVFNRDFSTTYFEGKNYSKLMNLVSPSQHGYAVGECLKYDGKFLSIKLTKPLNKGDEIQCRLRTHTLGTRCDEIYYKGEKIASAEANLVVEIPFKRKVPKGIIFYKTFDTAFIKNALLESQKEKAIYALELSFCAKIGKRPRLSGKVGDYKVFVELEEWVEKAIKVPLTEEKILQQLSKLGGTPFYFEALTCDMDLDASLPMSSINTLRRDVCNKLLVEIARRHDTRKISLDCESALQRKPMPVPNDEKFYFYFDDASLCLQAIENTNQNERCIFILENLDAYRTHVNLLIEKGVYFGFPKIVRNDEIELYTQFLALYGNAIKGFALSHIGQLEAISKIQNAQWIANETMPAFNSVSVQYLKEKGANTVFASLEWPIKTQNLEVGVFVYGKIPIMTSEYCPVGKVLFNKHKCGACKHKKYALKDREGVLYPIRCDASHCRVEILSDKSIFILDKLSELKSRGQRHFKLDFKGGTENEMMNLIALTLNEPKTLKYKQTIHTRGRLLDGVE